MAFATPFCREYGAKFLGTQASFTTFQEENRQADTFGIRLAFFMICRTMKLAPLADTIAQKVQPGTPWGDIRDECDQATGGDLDTTQLDILTDMVENRLAETNQNILMKKL